MFPPLDFVKALFRSRFLRKEDGATLVEYGLLLALIALICVAAMAVLGTKLSTVFRSLSTSI
jgi:pilus assembly protein Flp/PilA